MTDEKFQQLVGFIERLKARNKQKAKPKPVDTSALKQPVNTGNTQPKLASK
jgi:hypothetical protein